MNRTLFLLPLLFFASLALAANRGVPEACKRLCDSESECVRKCVSQAELFELRSDFIDASTAWGKTAEVRMRVLRSGANIDTIALCKTTGWSEENKLTCLRSYPTPSMLKLCKKLSSREEEQVQCLRTGKTEAEVDACINLVPGTDLRLECLHKDTTALETRQCNRNGLDSRARMNCLQRWQMAHEEEAKAFEREVRQRVAEEQRLEELENRRPASRRK